MNIVVLLKQTFDTEEKIRIEDGWAAENGVKFVINPYDEYALEEALRLREKHGGSVTALSCGPQRAAEALRTALAMGADEAVLLASDGLADDGHTVAAALTAVVGQLRPDLLLAGLFAIDRGAGSVALQVAERLGWPHASAAIGLEIMEADAGDRGPASSGAGVSADSSAAEGPGRKAIVKRDTESGEETVEVPLPALITAQQGLNDPRYPSLPGIMKAKRKPLRQLAPEELGLEAGDKKPRTERIALLAPPARAAGRKLTGTPAEQAAELAGLLKGIAGG